MAKKLAEVRRDRTMAHSSRVKVSRSKAKGTEGGTPLADLTLVKDIFDRLGKRGLPRLRVVIHPAQEGGFWAEVPALRGCITEGETLPEVVDNLLEAIAGWLEVAAESHPPEPDPNAIILELPL
jgi:predicted RNase H-like HicB family nuclease